MIKDFKIILDFFEKLDKIINKDIKIYLIGGAVLLDKGIKDSTKDIDLILNTKEEYIYFTKILRKNGFEDFKPEFSYKKLMLSSMLIKNNFRLDVFNKIVCSKLFLSENMIKRAELIKSYDNIKLFICSNEDILIFKSITERDGDIEDCIALNKYKLNWDIIFSEIKYQIKRSGEDIWITWFEERLNLLEDKGIIIPIIKDIRKLSEKYYNQLEKRLKNS